MLENAADSPKDGQKGGQKDESAAESNGDAPAKQAEPASSKTSSQQEAAGPKVAADEPTDAVEGVPELYVLLLLSWW